MIFRLKEVAMKYLIDKWCLHFDAYTWYRHRLLKRFMIIGSIRVLNIGTGGGIESLELLRRGNYVTAIEIDENTALRTLARIERNGFAKRFMGITGHILSVDIGNQFDEIYMCEVLEHIADDLSALRRISDWLVPGGRVILSTPTASYGQLANQPISIKEDGGHVRVGYDGPELDEMLEKVGLFTLRRVNNGNQIIQRLHFIEKWFQGKDKTY